MRRLLSLRTTWSLCRMESLQKMRADRYDMLIKPQSIVHWVQICKFVNQFYCETISEEWLESSVCRSKDQILCFVHIQLKVVISAPLCEMRACVRKRLFYLDHSVYAILHWGGSDQKWTRNQTFSPLFTRPVHVLANQNLLLRSPWPGEVAKPFSMSQSQSPEHIRKLKQPHECMSDTYETLRLYIVCLKMVGDCVERFDGRGRWPQWKTSAHIWGLLWSIISADRRKSASS